MSEVALSSDGMPVAYEVHGQGSPALVFVHGWSCDRKYWRNQLGHFDDRHRVVAIDLAGHGKSGRGRKAYTIPAFGDDVVAVVEKLGIDDIVLIGHSMGGDVIVEAALDLRERVRGLVWVDVYSTLGQISSRAANERFIAPFRQDFETAAGQFVRRMFLAGSDLALVESVVADMSGAPPEIAVDVMEHAINNDGAILAGLRELRVPIVAINPDHQPTDTEALRRHGVRAVTMIGVGHFPMLEDPAAFNRLLGEVIGTFARER
ncbi:MAG TPA: alpha/beta hydrolase [Candidatus Acidoferrum sp.]|jgi:pimeloyl-ACP methyl ester carboxylesterase|nr:alpha/beta hydrolase [Candidatus Acidoferrum sp.]